MANIRTAGAAFAKGGGLWCLVFSSLAFLLTYFSPIDYTFSDPWGNLLTAQAILEHGTVRLDAYADAPAIADLRLAWNHRGHLYYFFPTGTSVFALPAVWLAGMAGMDMAISEQNSALQTLLSALTVALTFPLVFVLCRCFVPRRLSLVLAVGFVFGSSTASTLGTALWSSNLTLLFNLLVVSLLARDRRQDEPGGANPYLLGLLLFCAYFCRPTAAVLVLVTFIYLAVRRRALLAPTVVAFSLPMTLFVLFSLGEYGSLLPPYYSASRLGSTTFPTALLGNLVSPSRGLLVLSPYLLLAVAGAVASIRRLRRDDLFVFGLAWLTLHWIAISSYSNWWGAWSFGNRLFADALPAAILLTAIVARARLRQTGSQQTGPRRGAQFATAGLVCLVAAAVYIHTWKGLYDVHPFRWCQDGTYVHHLFDWRHPQFMASAAALADHRRQHLLPALTARSLEQPIMPASRDVIFEGWSRPENGGAWRWSEGSSAALLFRVDAEPPGPLVLEIVAGTHQAQRIPVRVNGTLIGTITSTKNWTPARYSLPLDPASILGTEDRRPGEALAVEIELSIPGALSPASLDPEGRGDQRVLGLCLRQLTLSASSTLIGP